jgi:SAM-dependent methyltransferase
MITVTIKSLFKKAIPRDYHGQLRRLFNTLRYFGWSHFCPVCQSHVRLFLPHVSGGVSRPDADCPVCKSSERHRLAWLYFTRRTNLFKDNLTMVHFAPEAEISKNLFRIPSLNYITADLHRGVMLGADIASIPLLDNSVDVIYCSHVLNMIPDDHLGMKELYRILRPGGWALLQVPIRSGGTLEPLSSSNPMDRDRLFGHADMFRIYGPDFKQRLERAGFAVSVDTLFQSLHEKEIRRFGVKDEKLYVCRKQTPTSSLGWKTPSWRDWMMNQSMDTKRYAGTTS